MTTSSGSNAGTSAAPLRLADAAGAGLAAIIGGGLFVVFAPAAAAAGEQLTWAVVLAAVVTIVNVTSAVRLSATHRSPIGTHVHGRDRLGIAWGHLAAWAHVCGLVSACAALALTVGIHLWPTSPKVVGVVVVLVVLGLHSLGIDRSRLGERVIALLVMLVVFVFVDVLLATPPVLTDAPLDPEGSGGPVGIVRGAGFVLFAMTGYLTLVNRRSSMPDPARTLPRALAISLGAIIGLYLFVTVALAHTLGPGWVAARQAPLAEAAEISAWPWLGPVLRVAAVLAAGGVLLGLVLTASEVVASMARDRHLPPSLAVREGSRLIPRRAISVIVAFTIVSVILVDVRQAIAFASFCVLVHFTLVHASVWTLDARWSRRLLPALGIIGCLGVAVILPWQTVVAGVLVLLLGAIIGWVRHTTRE